MQKIGEAMSQAGGAQQQQQTSAGDPHTQANPQQDPDEIQEAEVEIMGDEDKK